MKLPADRVDIHLTPGTTARFRLDMTRREDGSWRFSGEVDIVAPKTSDEATASDKLTQTVEPVSLLETLVVEQEKEAMYLEALTKGHPTEPIIMQWLLTNPGVFNEYTAVRDMMGWSNRKAWENLFAGDTPVYIPSHMRAEKLAIWEALPREERIRRRARWWKQRDRNKARYEAYCGMISEAIQNINHHIGGPYPIRIEPLDKKDPHVPDRAAEPWLSRHTLLYRTIPLDMEVEAARIEACKRAADRGHQSADRSQSDSKDHPTFEEEEK